jgi:hypothetical protein
LHAVVTNLLVLAVQIALSVVEVRAEGLFLLLFQAYEPQEAALTEGKHQTVVASIQPVAVAYSD